MGVGFEFRLGWQDSRLGQFCIWNKLGWVGVSSGVEGWVGLSFVVAWFDAGIRNVVAEFTYCALTVSEMVVIWLVLLLLRLKKVLTWPPEIWHKLSCLH